MEHDEDEEPPLAIQIQADNESNSQQSSVGVTLITGYLGAGKSTVSFIPLSISITYLLIYLFFIMFILLLVSTSKFQWFCCVEF